MELKDVEDRIERINEFKDLLPDDALFYQENLRENSLEWKKILNRGKGDENVI